MSPRRLNRELMVIFERARKGALPRKKGPRGNSNTCPRLGVYNAQSNIRAHAKLVRTCIASLPTRLAEVSNNNARVSFSD